MTAFLSLSYSRGLSEKEVVEIDEQVAKNRETVYLFIRKLPSNSKRRAKRLCLYMIFVFTVSQPLAPCVAMELPATPAINRLSPMEKCRIKTKKSKSLERLLELTGGNQENSDNNKPGKNFNIDFLVIMNPEAEYLNEIKSFLKIENLVKVEDSFNEKKISYFFNPDVKTIITFDNDNNFLHSYLLQCKSSIRHQ